MSNQPPPHAPVQPIIDIGHDAETRLRIVLTARCGLDEAAINAILQMQEQSGMSFAEAAIRLGHVSRAELDEAEMPIQAPAIRDRMGIPCEQLVLAHDSHHPRSEQLRTLRTELLLRHEHSDSANIMAVLSPCAGEGRSQLAAELAIVFAQLGRPTLLVDADLRHPRQHLLFSADNQTGLSRALADDEAPRFQSIAGLPSLSLLTAGPLPSNPLELLSDRGFESLVEDWQRRFQFVVFDTPAVGLYADGLAVATIIGRVLSLSRAGHTPYKGTRDMMRRLAATQSRILGSVINHF